MSRFCILTNTKEFKNAQLKFNLDKYSLEKIVYNYYNNVVNSENTFPSDDYIDSIINPTIVTEDKKLVDFSKKHGYDKPLIFNNLDNFESKLKEVQQFFTSDLIVTYTNFKGQSVIKVANFEYKEKEQKQTKLDKELEEIKRNAIANGTFMKAPNGKPTNLNERQWLQVRTKTFKEWFGDWEKLAKESQTEIDFVQALQNFKSSNDTIDKKSIALSNLKSNEKSDEQVLLDAGYKKVGNIFVSPNFDKRILSIIPTQLLSIMEKAGIKVISFGQGDYSAMSGGIKINGHSIGEIRFTSDNDAERIAHNILHEIGHYLYNYYLNENDRSTASTYTTPISFYVQNLINNTRTSGASIGEENFVEGFATYFHNKIFGNRSLNTNIESHLVTLYRNLFEEFGNNNSDVSKVVDENGEPLVVYHNSESQFSSFSYEHVSDPESGFFFSSDENYASQFGTEKYPVFLNVRNPIRTDIPLHRKNLISIYRNEWKEGTDGVIGKDEVEEGLKPSNGNEWMVFRPNQIKSATDNSGEFSTENDNVYKENISFENEKAIGKPDSKLLQMFAKSRRIMLSGNKELTARDLMLIIKDSRYSSIITLLKALNKIGELDNVKVQLVSGSARSFNRRRAYYNASEKTIYVNTEAQYEDGNSSSVLLHEILHSITVDRIQQNPELRKEMQEIMNEYQAVYYNSRYDTRLDSILEGHHAMEEFIADVWSNPETINNLKNVKTKENKNKSLWDRFKQFFHNLFSGIFLGVTNDSLFAKASSSIIKLLETQAESIAVGKYYENGVPIKPNAEQELAIDIMADYVTDRIEGKQTHPFFLLNGKAGTGKTTIINMLLERLNKEGKLGNVIVAAVANKAKQNLFRKTNYRELKIKSSSVSGILGKGNFLRQQGSGTGYERMSTKKFGAVIENSDLKGPENIIVIDECSMIETKDYEALLALLALRNLTLIFVGDSGQLPQIQNNKAQSNTPVSKTFTESSVNASATLLTRVRQGENNPILEASDLFYVRGYEVDNSDPKRNLSLAKLDTKITDRGAFILKNNDQFDYEKDASALFKRAIETGNTNLVKYVCATNEEVSSFNDLVRRSVFGKEYTKMFKEGDIVMFREQFSARRSNNPNGKAEKIDNSQEGIIKSFEELSKDDVTSREGYLSPFVLFCKKLNDYAEKHNGKMPLNVDEMGEELTKLWKELPVISTFIYDEKAGTPFYEGTDGKLYNVLDTIYLYAKRIKDIKPVRSVSIEMETQSETASEPGLYEMLTIHPEDWEQYEKNIKLLQDNTYFDETNIIQVITRQLFNAIGLKGSIDLKVLRQLGAEMINNSYTNTRARLQYGYAITSHKSQGSTYDVSIINGDSMGKNRTWGFQDKQRMMYTAITRSSNVTMVITNDAFGIRDTEPLDVINERINANKKKTGIDHTGETYKPENIDRTDNTPQTPQTPLVEDKVKTINIDGAATEIEYKYINEKTDKLPQRSADGSIMMYNVTRDLVLQYLFNDNSYKEALDKLSQEGYNRNYINSIISNDNAAESFVLLNQYIGFIFKDRYKCLKETLNQLAQNTGNSSPEVAISEPMPKASVQEDDFIEDAEFEDISNEETLSSIPTENINTLGEKVEYTPQGKERQTYYIKDNHIYNSKGKEVFAEPSKDRTAIFTNYRVQRGEAVVVEHKGNKYVVNNKDLIVSVRSKKIMEWGEENGDRKAILQLAKLAFELKLNNNQQQSEHNNNIHIEVSTSGYRKGDPQRNPTVAYIFTENAEAYGYTHNIDIWHNRESEFPFKGTPKINVSDVNGTNLAGIRTDNNGNISKNAFGIVVKKYQQNAYGRFVAQEGTFKDTDSDFELFTSLNQDMLLRLEKSGLTSIVFPSQIALGKAALPLRFAEWLKQQLESRFNITTKIKTNRRKDYIGYGLELKNDNIKSIIEQPTTTNTETKDYYLHSGGAEGSDYDGWDLIAREFGGLKGYNHYYHGQKSPKNAPHGNIQLTDELFKEGVQHMNYAASKLGKQVSNPYTIDKLARNWWQAKNGDAVFAIGNEFVTAPNGNVYVKGGTGWAVQMAIDSNKPVYVFLQSTNNWYKRVGDNWVITETPTLTKNFAGIGTRELNESGKQAIRNVYNKTFNANYQQEKVEAVKEKIGEEGIQDTLDTLNGKKDELNSQERKSAKTLFGTRQPKVLIASETSDPVFHALKIKRMVEAELAKPAHKRNFHMLYIITKHDGLPLADLVKLDIPKFIHFSITSLGGTKYEPGVMKMDDLLDRIQDFINQGVLNPNLITIRIDPIIPGVTKDEDIEHIIERAKSMGIKQFKFSIMDSYGYTSAGRSTNSRDRFIIEKMRNLGYDWNTYYGIKDGVVEFHAKQQYIEHYYKLIDSLAEKHNVWFNTCGENSHGIQGLKRIKFNMGCVNVEAMNAAADTNDIADIQGNQRRDCSCYGLKSDALRYGDNCQSSCIYCYAGHNQDSARQYYNEDGTLKDDMFTRTTEPKVEQPAIEDTPQIQQEESRAKYENPFILEKSEINSENSIYPAEYVLSVNEEYLSNIEEKADDSMKVLSKFLDGVINFNDLPFGAKIRINTGNDRLDVKIQQLFRKNRLLHSTTEFRTIDVDLTTKEGANFVTYLKNIGVISRSTGTLKSGSVVSKVGIYAYTYVKKQRDIENSKQMKELNDKVSGRRLRSLSIGAIYKISELVTQIQDGNSVVDTLFTGKLLEEIKELKGKDRITIIGKIGIAGLALIVKDRYFNVNASDETRNKSLDNLNRKKRKEVKAIYDNFEAFINFGYAKLEELEGISVDANPHMSQSIIELYDGIDEQEVQELYGSSLEHWLVGFRSVSAIMNLSRLVKSALNNMYDYDIDFNVVKDEYGLEKRVNAAEAVSNMLSWFISVENVDDMVKVLQQKMEKHPWLAQLVNDDPDLKDSEGNLVGIGKLITKDKNKRHPENEEFRSKFFRNMYLYFQKYGIIQADGNIKVINDKSDIASVTDEVLTNIKTNKELFNNDIPVGKSDESFVSKLIEARKKITDRLNIKGNVEIDDEIVKDVKEIFNLLGINLFNEEAIKAVLTANPKYLIQLAKSTSTSNGIANLFLSYNRDSKIVDDDFWKSYKNDINKIIKPFTDFIVSRMESVTYQDGKLYYSYVLPSYMSKFNTKIKNGNGFMEKEFKSEFFGLMKDGKKQWLNEWQKRLATEDKAREDFSHKAVLVDNGVSYTKKTPKQYMSSILNEYLYDKYKRLAWYRIPMMSNKPSEEYIRFYRYTEGFKSQITDLLVSTTMQEILRISDVLNRAKSVEAGDLSGDSIVKFYDIKTEYKKEAKDRHSDEELISMGIKQGAGTRFIMLSFLQPYIQYALDNKKYQGLGRQLLDLILGNSTNTKENSESESESESNPVDFFGGEAEVGENTTLSLLRTAIMHEMNNSFQEFLATMEAEGVIERDKKGNYKTDVKKLGSTNKEILNTLEEFFWNDFYAATSILLLYVTDPAYYGTAEELQKRLAQLHAPGSRLNVLARDKNGKLYSADEKGKHIYRLIKLADDNIISDAISNVNEVFDLLVEENNGNAPAIAYYEAQRKFIISKLEKVNVTDAQTFCTPTAMRKKLGMLGEWNEARERAYQNLVKGTHTKSDLSILMQPLKPFMFSQKQVSESGGLFNTRRVGVQVKTSEYLLLLADAITRGAGKKTKLATIFDVIEETLTTTDTYGNKVPNGKGIDGISFESSIKTGLSGIINLNGLTNELVEQTLRRCIYAGSNGTNTTSQYNKTFVDELDYEDYSIQQEVPTHFFGKQQLGSQSKALMFADTEEYERDENGKYRKGEDGNKVDRYIYVKDKKGNRVRTTVREAKQRYFKLLADSINNAKEKLIKELNLDSANEGILNIAISELLKKQILEDSRFGSDLLWAVDTNEKGEFNLPLSDPTHSVRIQLLLYAVIKNRIYKQEIHGGPVVQVSNWGNEDLHIRYTNKDGETLLTELEFNSLKERANNVKNIKDKKAQRAERASILDKLSEHASTTVSVNGKTVSLNTYEQYKKHHMVDGGVVYECYAPVYDERLLKYEDKNGTIDVKRIKQEEPQLLELIGYRIPTEAKYSMASLRIVGFLPREAGEGIMLPKEWTSISGSDFDVDKLYIMRRSFIEVGDEENGLRWQKGTTKQDEINDEIFDIMQGVLESNQALSKVVKIGTFDPLKVVGYKLAALRELKAQNQRENILIEARNKAKKPDEVIEKYKEFKDTYDSLPNSINALKDLAIKSKNLSMAHVHLQFFKLNMVAAKLIGVFAQSNISHAYLQMYASSVGSERGIQIEDLEFAQFNLFGQLIHKNDFYIDSLYGFDGTPISDNIAAFLAASVDAVKDPILNLMNVNMKTVNAVMMMARMGFNIEQIGLLFGQDIVTRLTQRMDKYGEMFSEAIENELKALQRLVDADKELSGVKFDLNLSDKELKLNLIKPSLQLDYTILKVLQQINKISDDTRSIVHMTRFNSISSAKGPNIIEAIVEQFKTDAYWRSLGDKNDRLNAAILNPVLSTTTEAVDSLERMLIGNRFVLAKSHFAETYKAYVQMIGRDVNLIDKKDAKRFSDFYIDYMIQKVSNLFDLSYEHRLEVVSTYPELILALKSDPRFTDNKFVQSIQQRQDKKDKYLGINIELLGVTSDNIEEIKTDFNEFADEEPEMTRKLIEYMFNRGGFSFSPKTFTNLITNYIKNKLMPEYLKNVRELEKENGYLERKDNVELMELSDDIIYQYMLHYGAKNFRKANVSSLDDLELPKSKNNTTDLTLGDTFTIYNGIVKDLGIYLLTLPMKNPLKSTDMVFLTVKVDNTTRNGISTVTVVEKLGGDGLGIEINPDEDVVKSIYNLEKDNNNTPPETPSPTEPNKPSDSISNPTDNDYYESLDEAVQSESVRNPRGNSRTNEFLKFKSNPLTGGNSYLALLLNTDSQQPVTNAVLNTDVDIEKAVESAINTVNETETYPISLQLDYADSLTQTMVDMGIITLEQGNNSAETDRQSTNCK